MKEVLILGTGAWGTAFSILLSSLPLNVTVWGRNKDYIAYLDDTRENTKYLPGVKIPPRIKFTSEIRMQKMDICVIAIPVQFLRRALSDLKEKLKEVGIFVLLSKGIEIETLKRPSELIQDILDRRNFCVLSGPSHAEEVARFLPASVVVASDNEYIAKQVQESFMSQTFRIYVSKDVVGVELASALKNVIAIAAGIADSLGLGDNAKAALIARGLIEIARLGMKLGARQETFFGLAGLGDLVTTCYSPYGRNLYVGREIGKGNRLDKVLKRMHAIAEGVWTSKSALSLSQKYNVEMPITYQVNEVLFNGKDPKQALKELMTRSPKPEFYGI
jgi:glycerol-3-phosphate dehydrogenase (NAD(P)+)